tara:strand:- start:13435 stop:15423 length:1989 start_codon:yes stop_codon:yes gene_type:complete
LFLIRILSLLFFASFSTHLLAIERTILTNNVDSLKTEHKTQEGLELATTLIQLVDYYRNVDMDSSVYYAIQLQNLSDSLNFYDGKLAAVTGLVNADFVRGNYVQGIERALPFLKSTEETENYYLGDLYLATGNCYGSLGLYKTGVEYYLEARKIFSALKAEEKLRTISNNLGAYYIRMGNYNSALEVFSNLSVEKEDDPVRVTQKVNFGFIYIGLNEFNRAEEYFLDVLEMGNSDIEIRGKAISSFKLGNLYSKQKDYENALLYHKKSLEFYSKLNNEAQTMNPLNGMADVYFSLGDIEKAKEIALQSEQIGLNTQTLLELNQVTNLIARIYATDNNFEKAYDYSQKNLALSDSLNISKRNQEVQVMETEYRFERREEELKREQHVKLRKQELLSGGIASFLLISLVFVFLVYRSKKTKEKANTRLEKLNHDLEETNRIKNQLFSIIAHDLRNPLSSLYGLVTLLEMKATNKKELEKLIPELVAQFKHTSTLVNNLLNWSKSQMEGYKVLPTSFDIDNVIKRNLDLLSRRFKEKEISIKLQNNSSNKVFADKNMIDIVVLNLLSNALKYSDKEDSVTIEVLESNHETIISVKDTGTGIPESKLGILFTNSFYSTSGTRNERGTGLGLMLCKEFIKLNHGKIWVESEFGVGTTIYFSIPTQEP